VERVSRVFGRHSYFTLGAANASKSQSLLKETKSGSGKSRHNPITDLSELFDQRPTKVDAFTTCWPGGPIPEGNSVAGAHSGF
jgi:hypothetical protein